MLSDEFRNLPSKVVFGWRSRFKIESLITSNENVLVTCGSSTIRSGAIYNEFLDLLKTSKTGNVHEYQFDSREPTVDTIDRAVNACKSIPADVVISIGGGAAIDAAKAVAALYAAPDERSIKCYLEGIGDGSKLTWDPLRIIALPTTAGTGSEVTKNAVVQCDIPAVKKSLRDIRLIPAFAIVDPEFTISCSPEVTAHSGMDAITQCIEAYVSCRATEQTRLWASAGLKYGLSSISDAFLVPTSQDARTKMAACATLSGFALAYGGLGLAHGVAAALGSICGVRHGLACAILLPISIRENLKSDVQRYNELASCVGLRDGAELLTTIERLNAELGIPAHLSDVGVKRSQLKDIVSLSYGNSMSGNPKPVTKEHLFYILDSVL